ncbi:MAG: DUF4340 domain-containing protein [Deltaproteobacteria bacterium]|nr:DUF4340 domain-containing protein [Deltaproteobacteria bacterium]
MKVYKLLIYLFILVALLTYIYFVEIRHKQAESERKEKASRIVQLDKDDIDEIKIKVLEGPSIDIKKSAPDKWNMVRPINVSADLRAVRNLLTAATLAQPEKVVMEKDVKWEDYGLVKPNLEISLTAPKRTVAIAFGASNPAKSSYYLKVKGDQRLFLVPDTLRISLNKTVFDLRDKSVSQFSPDDIEKLEIIRDGRDIELQKISGKWRMIKPSNILAKSSKIEALLRGISGLRAKEIIDSPAAEKNAYDFENSKNKIILYGKDFSKTFTFGALKEKKSGANQPSDIRYLLVSGQEPVYVVDDSFFTGAKLDPDSLTDRSIVMMDPLTVQKILFEFMGKSWEFAKTGENKWEMQQPEHRDKLDDWRISEILWSLKDLNYKSMISPIPDDLAPYRLNMPQLTISIYQKAAEKPVKIIIGWPPQKGDSSDQHKDNSQGTPGTPETAYAKVDPQIDGERAIYVLDGGFIGRLRINLDQLGKKE